MSILIDLHKGKKVCRILFLLSLIVSILLLEFIAWSEEGKTHYFALMYHFESAKHFNTTFSICPKFKGRLGNQMFIFATSFAIALSKRMDIEVNKESALYKTFNLSVGLQGTSLSKCSSDVKILREKHSAVFDKSLTEFKPESSVSLQNYLQSYLYFINRSNEIRQQFQFRSHIKQQSSEIFSNICKKYSITDRTKYTFIGVHVRRGDMAEVSEKDKKSGYNLATKEYLLQSVSYYKTKYINTIFLVITNGLKWTQQNMPKGIVVEYIHNKPASIELATVTLSDHFITTIGSFSWWAGWLTAGEVLYFKWPAKNGSQFRKAFSHDYTDFFPLTWKGL